MVPKTQVQIVLFIICILFFPRILQGQQHLQKDTLVVAVAGSAPFVFEEGQEDRGIAIEIWDELAGKHDWNYEFKNYESVEAALQSLNEGESDLVVGPISITSNRVENYRFSQPFYNSS